MKNRIGIDAGGSLLKIAFEENDRLHFRKYPIEDINEALEWLKMIAINKTVYLTGGRAGKIKAEYFTNAEIVDEFTAACEGAKYLMTQEGVLLNEKSLLVNIGTGTSWFTIEGEHYERVLGSGIGGGTFMGTGNILADSKDFSTLVNLSVNGERGKVDLLVKDIYYPDEPPIPGALTASNFAKSAANAPSSPADQMASVLNMISETITLLTVQTAALYRIKKAIFIGSTLAGNKPLQDSLDIYCKMSGIDPFFLPNGQFSGAIGVMQKK
jgi:type II pantothenate kinase